MVKKLNTQQIEQVLSGNTAGRIACEKDGSLQVVLVNYFYDGKQVIICAGEENDTLSTNTSRQVCFEIDETKPGLDLRSVILWGQFEEIADENQHREAMTLFKNYGIEVKKALIHSPDKESNRHHSLQSEPPFLYRLVIADKRGYLEETKMPA